MDLFHSDADYSGVDVIRRSLEEADRLRTRAVKGTWITIVVLVVTMTLLGAAGLLRTRSEPRRATTPASSVAATGVTGAESPATREATLQVAASAASAAVVAVPPPGARSAGMRTRSAARAAPASPPKHSEPRTTDASSAKPKRQPLAVAVGRIGYEPSTLRAKAGAPITLVVGKGEGCAAGFLMPALGVNADNSRGRVSIDIGVVKPGTYTFTCGMGMVSGRLIVRS